MNPDFDGPDDEKLALGVRDGIRVGGVVILLALVFAIVVALAGCGTVKQPHPEPVVDPTGATCASACSHLEELGCGGGPRCVPACENIQASGVFAYDVGASHEPSTVRRPTRATTRAIFLICSIFRDVDGGEDDEAQWTGPSRTCAIAQDPSPGNGGCLCEAAAGSAPRAISPILQGPFATSNQRHACSMVWSSPCFIRGPK